MKRVFLSSFLLCVLLTLFYFPLFAQSSSEQAEILIIPLSPFTVEKASGVLEVQISTFSPILKVTLNNEIQTIPKGENSLLKLSFPVPFTLGINQFEIVVQTSQGQAHKNITITYALPESQAQSKAPDAFSLITILGMTTSDNINKSSETLESASTQSLIFVPSYRFGDNVERAFSLKGVLMGNRNEEAYQSKDIRFKQMSVQWLDKKNFLGELTWTLGHNEAGAWDEAQTSDSRDSLFSQYKRASVSNFISLHSKNVLGKKKFWKWQLDYKSKGTGADAKEPEIETGLLLAYKTPLGPLQSKIQSAFVDIKNEGATQGNTAIKTQLKVTFPIASLSLSLRYDHIQTEDKNANSSLDSGKEKQQDQTLALGVTYPISSGFILSLNQKQQAHSSNVSGREVTVNSSQLQIILVY